MNHCVSFWLAQLCHRLQLQSWDFRAGDTSKEQGGPHSASGAHTTQEKGRGTGWTSSSKQAAPGAGPSVHQSEAGEGPCASR